MFSHREALSMTGTQWLNDAQRLITERASEVECSRPDGDTLTLSNAIRGVVPHGTGEGIPVWKSSSTA